MPEGLTIPPGKFVAKNAISRKDAMPKGVYRFSRPSLRGGAYPLVVKGNRHVLALTYVLFIPMPFWASERYQ